MFAKIDAQSKKKGKDQESIQSSTTPDPGYQQESTTSQLDITKESLEVGSFSAGQKSEKMEQF